MTVHHGSATWLLLGALAGVAMLPAAYGLPAGGLENPYGVITNRNAFGIRPPPEPEAVTPPTPPAPPPNVFLTGVTRERGVKRAFFVINRPGAKAPDYESAVEGDEIQDLRIQEINAAEGKVRVLVSGREVVLNFAENGMKSTGGTAVPPGGARPGGAVAQPVAPVPQPTGGGGPVVIGRGGVNVNESGSGLGGGVPAPVNFPGATGDGGNGVSQGQVLTPAPRTLPARALTRGNAVQDQVQPVTGTPESGGTLPIPIPPPSRFAQ